MALHSSIVSFLLNAPTSLADLQMATQVSLPTLRKAVQELIDAQWVQIVGQADANGGRPAMLFGVDDRYFAIIGIHLQLPGVRLITASLTGQVLDEVEILNDIVPSLDESIRVTAEYVSHIQKTMPERQLLGIGVASPGFIDPDSGDIITVVREPSWSNYPFCRRLQVEVGLPVYIANDVDCMAYAEFEHNTEAIKKNLAYVGFDEGVKVSLFLNGEIYKGSLGNAGLISSHLLHVNEKPDFPDTKTMLSLVGINKIFEQMVSELDREKQSLCAPILSEPNIRNRFQMIIDHAQKEMPVCYTIIRGLNRVLSAAIANMIYIVQPDVIVIGGFLSSLPGEHYRDLENAIRHHLPKLINNNLIIQQGTITSQNSAAIGAVYHFVKHYLADSSVELT